MSGWHSGFAPLVGWRREQERREISTYSMIHHNKVPGRGVVMSLVVVLVVEESSVSQRGKEEEEMEEEEEEDKEERWVREKKEKEYMGRWGTCCVWPMVTGDAGLWMTHHCFTSTTHTHTHTHNTQGCSHNKPWQTRKNTSCMHTHNVDLFATYPNNYIRHRTTFWVIGFAVR